MKLRDPAFPPPQDTDPQTEGARPEPRGGDQCATGYWGTGTGWWNCV